MRLVTMTAPGRLELNFMWLPTWLGINREAVAAVEKEIAPKVVGRAATEEELDAINDEVLDILTTRYPQIEGLRDFLDGLKFVGTS
jgi:hypothetical protein